MDGDRGAWIHRTRSPSATALRHSVGRDSPGRPEGPRLRGGTLVVVLAGILLLYPNWDALSGDGVEQRGRMRPVKSLDLYADRADANGFPINPHWVAQDEAHGGLFAFLYRNGYANEYRPEAFTRCQRPLSPKGMQSCTDQLTSFDWTGELLFICNPNVFKPQPIAEAVHFNWGLVTYMGTLHANGPSDDGDFELNVSPLPVAGVAGRSLMYPGMTVGNFRYRASEGRLHTEVNNAEGFYLFGNDKGWLGRIADLMAKLKNNPGPSDRPQLIRELKKELETRSGRTVVIAGLFGLDAEHHAAAEIHPVFAMAVSGGIEADAMGESSETWSFFIRSRGDQGSCGRTEHSLPLPASKEFYLTLPWPAVKQWDSTLAVATAKAWSTLDERKEPAPLLVQYARDAGVWLGTQVEDPPGGGLFMMYGEVTMKYGRTGYVPGVPTLAEGKPMRISVQGTSSLVILRPGQPRPEIPKEFEQPGVDPERPVYLEEVLEGQARKMFLELTPATKLQVIERLEESIALEFRPVTKLKVEEADAVRRRFLERDVFVPIAEENYVTLKARLSPRVLAEIKELSE
jgi:hypothetical protein